MHSPVTDQVPRSLHTKPPTAWSNTTAHIADSKDPGRRCLPGLVHLHNDDDEHPSTKPLKPTRKWPQTGKTWRGPPTLQCATVGPRGGPTLPDVTPPGPGWCRVGGRELVSAGLHTTEDAAYGKGGGRALWGLREACSPDGRVA